RLTEFGNFDTQTRYSNPEGNNLADLVKTVLFWLRGTSCFGSYCIPILGFNDQAALHGVLLWVLRQNGSHTRSRIAIMRSDFSVPTLRTLSMNWSAFNAAVGWSKSAAIPQKTRPTN